MSKSMRLRKSNVDTRIGEEIEDVVQMTSIEGQRCGVNSGQE